MALVGSNEIPNKGTIRVERHTGLQLTKDTKRVGFDACVVDNPHEDKTWDLLVGMDFNDSMGKMILTTEEDKKTTRDVSRDGQDAG